MTALNHLDKELSTIIRHKSRRDGWSYISRTFLDVLRAPSNDAGRWCFIKPSAWSSNHEQAMTRLDMPEGSRKYRGDKFVMDDARGPHRADGVNVGRCEVNE